MIVYSAPLGVSSLLPPAECLDISTRGARGTPPSAGAWLSPRLDTFETWQAANRRADRSGVLGPILRLNGWRRFDSAYRESLLSPQREPRLEGSAFKRAILSRPRLYLLDDGDGRPVHASLPPCDPERTPRRVVRGVLVAMGAEDGGEWVGA